VSGVYADFVFFAVTGLQKRLEEPGHNEWGGAPWYPCLEQIIQWLPVAIAGGPGATLWCCRTDITYVCTVHAKCKLRRSFKTRSEKFTDAVSTVLADWLTTVCRGLMQPRVSF